MIPHVVPVSMKIVCVIVSQPLPSSADENRAWVLVVTFEKSMFVATWVSLAPSGGCVVCKKVALGYFCALSSDVFDFVVMSAFVIRKLSIKFHPKYLIRTLKDLFH